MSQSQYDHRRGSSSARPVGEEERRAVAPSALDALLHAQRVLGNRTARGLVTDGTRAHGVGPAGPTLHRKMGFAESQLLADKHTFRKDAAAKLGLSATNTWKLIQRDLAAYWASTSAVEQQELLVQLSRRIAAWKHGHKGTSSGQQAKRMNLDALEKAINDEWPRVVAEASYVRDLKPMSERKMAGGKYSRRGHDKFRYMSQIASNQVVQQLDTISAAKDTSPRSMAIREHNLSDADVAAIGIYSVDDYKYINPAEAHANAADDAGKASADKWMERQVFSIDSAENAKKPDLDKYTKSDDFLFHLPNDAAGRDEARAEGAVHANMLKSALEKLPDYVGEVYRGQTVPKADLKKTVTKGKVLTFGSFTSSSWDAFQSIDFVQRETARSAKEGRDDVGLLYQIRVQKGTKDISSIALKEEEREVLWLPNQKIRVESVQTPEQAGAPYYVVRCTQTDDKGKPLKIAPTPAEEFRDANLQGKKPNQASPRALLMMGGPGAGKSTVLGTCLPNSDQYVRIDPDKAKEAMPEYQAGVAVRDKDIAAKVHARSKHVAGTLLTGAMSGRYHMIYDGTGANASEYKSLIKMLKSKGYAVRVVMVGLPVDAGWKRVQSRAKKEGRLVAEKTTRDIYFEVNRNFTSIAKEADEAELWENVGTPQLTWDKAKGSDADLAAALKALQ